MTWIGWLRCEKFRSDFVARSFALIAPVQPVLHQVSCSYETIPNAPKYYETNRNIRKITMRLRGTNFALIAPVKYVLQQVSCSYGTIQNAPKYYETHRNIGIGSNVVDWLCSLQKISTRLRGMNFCNNCTSSTHFAPSFMQLRNDPKCIQTL